MNHSVIDSSVSVSLSALFFYRLFVFLFCFYAYLSHFIGSNTESFVDAMTWFEYLTHWDAVNMCIYFGLASGFTLAAIKDPNRSLTPLSSSKLGCFVHFMYELTGLTAWFVSILYWAALYPVDPDPPQGYFAFLNVCMHGLPALWVLVDIFLGSGVQVQFHLWMIYVYLIVYLIVNALITVDTSVPIYSILTFRNATTAIWVVISLVLVAVVWLLNYLCIRLRARCCSRNRAHSVVVFSKDAPKASGV